MVLDDPWIGIEDVTKYLNVQRQTIYRWIENNSFPARKAGRLLRFKISEIDEWVRREDKTEVQKKG